jgi:hypothetical protein
MVVQGKKVDLRHSVWIAKRTKNGQAQRDLGRL